MHVFCTLYNFQCVLYISFKKILSDAFFNNLEVGVCLNGVIVSNPNFLNLKFYL